MTSTIENLSMHKRQGAGDEGDKNVPLTNVSFELLPGEIQDMALSYLTFRERIRYTVVCRSWRSTILSSPRTWHTLSNEENRHNLSQVLLPYKNFIREDHVREIDLKLFYQGYAYSDEDEGVKMVEETNRLLEFLMSVNCKNIEKVTLVLPVFSWPWISKFIWLNMPQSLTHLAIRCGVNLEHSLARALPMVIMTIYPNLQYLCFILWDAYGIFVYLEDNYEEEREVHLEEPPILHSPINLTTHHRLSTIYLDISPRELRPSFPVDIIGRLQNLRHIRFTPDVFPSRILITRFYENLHDYCTELKTLECLYHMDDAILSEQSTTNGNRNESYLSTATTNRGLNNVKLIAVHGASDIMSHLQFIIPRHHTSLKYFEIRHLSNDHLGYLRQFNFPSLKKVTCQSSEQRMLMQIWPDMSRHLILFLDNADCLEQLELRLMRINDVFLESLSMRTTLQTLTIVGCVGISSSALSAFRACSSANLILKG